MSERENNVYKAKLAEQAERYDGELNFARKSMYFAWKIGKFKAATLKKIFFSSMASIDGVKKNRTAITAPVCRESPRRLARNASKIVNNA